MKNKNIFWGLALIFLAILLILDIFHVFDPLTAVMGRVSVWTILAGILLISFIVSCLIKGKISRIFIPSAFLLILFEKNLSILCDALTPELFNNWLILLVAVLFTVGFHILLSPLKKRSTAVADVKKHAGGSFGHSTVYIDSETMLPNHIENKLGSCVVYFENIGAFTGSGSIRIENNLGSIQLYVPRTWHIRNEIENVLGGIIVPEREAHENAPTLVLCGKNNLGSVEILDI